METKNIYILDRNYKIIFFEDWVAEVLGIEDHLVEKLPKNWMVQSITYLKSLYFVYDSLRRAWWSLSLIAWPCSLIFSKSLNISFSESSKKLTFLTFSIFSGLNIALIFSGKIGLSSFANFWSCSNDILFLTDNYDISWWLPQDKRWMIPARTTIKNPLILLRYLKRGLRLKNICWIYFIDFWGKYFLEDCNLFIRCHEYEMNTKLDNSISVIFM